MAWEGAWDEAWDAAKAEMTTHQGPTPVHCTMVHKSRPKATRWQTTMRTIRDRVLSKGVATARGVVRARAVATARGVARASARGDGKAWEEVKGAG